MSNRFSAFSFVDRITELDAEGRVRGSYRIPAGVDRFPASLMAEATGQLAAWAAMERVDFRLRPVAGIAAEAHYFGGARPGQQLELGADLETCSEEAVVYSGWAKLAGETVMTLTRCLGPMLPTADFDNPAAVRDRFHVLRSRAGGGGIFRGVPRIRHDPVEHLPGKRLITHVQVPEQADFFGDHFPRRPVYPATLLLDAMSDAAVELARESGHWEAGEPMSVSRVSDMKVRAFISPGTALEIQIDLTDLESSQATAKLAARMEGRRVATAKAEIRAI